MNEMRELRQRFPQCSCRNTFLTDMYVQLYKYCPLRATVERSYEASGTLARAGLGSGLFHCAQVGALDSIASHPCKKRKGGPPANCLLVPQRYHRIDLGAPARRNVTAHSSDDNQHDGDTRKCQWIRDSNFVKQPRKT